jgi:Acetyltransferase (GNAT) family.
VASYELQGQAKGFAEIAFAVPDRMHGRGGVATLLLEHLVSLARSRGLRGFTAETLSENTPMLRVFADAGLPARKHLSYGTVELTFPLPTGTPTRASTATWTGSRTGRAGPTWPACGQCSSPGR